jgi:hypothetical protein
LRNKLGSLEECVMKKMRVIIKTFLLVTKDYMLFQKIGGHEILYLGENDFQPFVIKECNNWL